MDECVVCSTLVLVIFTFGNPGTTHETVAVTGFFFIIDFSDVGF